MKIVKLAAVLVVFVALAGIAGMLAGDRLPRTSVVALEINDCAYSYDGELTVPLGQNISLRVTSNMAGEFHIHGYDILRDLESDQTEAINFRAVQSGIFDMEHHDCAHQHIELVVLNEDGTEPSRQHHEATEHEEGSEGDRADSPPNNTANDRVSDNDHSD